jgi:UDP:flavonoid glycosyltransferase YjiC (YdhE family)
LYPSIGVARSLQARGHEIAFVTNTQYTGLLSGLGLARIPRGATDGESFQVAQWGQPISIAIQVKHIEYALGSFQADILVGQALTYGPLLVSARRQLPVGLLGLCTYLWPARDQSSEESEEDEAADISIHASVEEWRAWRYRGMRATLNQTYALFRLPSCGKGCRDTPLLGDLFLLQNVPELEPTPEDLPEKVHLVGSCLWEPEACDLELEEWLAEGVRTGSPLIYVQHGRSFHIPNYWHRLVNALAGKDYRVAASVGRLDGEIGSLPENFFVRPHVPQGKVLSKARAVVASANTTAALGALTAGIPSLLIPAGGEQPDVAELCRSAGVAKILLPEEASPERIQTEIGGLLASSSFRERARHYASAFMKLSGCERAADLLETLARTRSPVLRGGKAMALMELTA